jgi:hypothetical protein
MILNKGFQGSRGKNKQFQEQDTRLKAKIKKKRVKGETRNSPSLRVKNLKPRCHQR